jgi:phage tail-like protein
MAAGKREDPVCAFNFAISLMDASSGTGGAVTTLAINTLTHNIDAGFNECSGLEMTLETEEYMEGGVNETVHKFPTRIKWGKLVLKKGLLTKTDLWDWIYGFTLGKVVRKDGVITLLNEKGLTHTAWQFMNGLPTKWTGPSLNSQQSAVAFESIEIEHEGLKLLTGASGLGAAINSAAEGIANLIGGN